MEILWHVFLFDVVDFLTKSLCNEKDDNHRCLPRH